MGHKKSKGVSKEKKKTRNEGKGLGTNGKGVSEKKIWRK